MPDPQTGDMRQIWQMMLALPLASSRLSKLCIPFQNNILDGDLCKNLFYFHIFSFFLILKHNFFRCLDFIRIAASNTASDDITNSVTHRIFNTDLLYSVSHFLVEVDEKSSHNGVFKYDLMMISDSGLLFAATLYVTCVLACKQLMQFVETLTCR